MLSYRYLGACLKVVIQSNWKIFSVRSKNFRVQLTNCYLFVPFAEGISQKRLLLLLISRTGGCFTLEHKTVTSQAV